MTPADPPKLRQAKQALSRSILNEGVLLHPATGHYYSLNATAVRLWDFFSEGHTVEEAVRWIASQSGSSPEEIRPDIERYIQELCDENLLEVS